MTADEYLTLLNDAAHRNKAIGWGSIEQRPSLVASCAHHPLGKFPLLSEAAAAAIAKLLRSNL